MPSRSKSWSHRVMSITVGKVWRGTLVPVAEAAPFMMGQKEER